MKKQKILMKMLIMFVLISFLSISSAAVVYAGDRGKHGGAHSSYGRRDHRGGRHYRRNYHQRRRHGTYYQGCGCCGRRSHGFYYGSNGFYVIIR